MWLNPQETADLVTFTEEILNGNFYFLCCVRCKWTLKMSYLLMAEKSFESFLIYQVLRCHENFEEYLQTWQSDTAFTKILVDVSQYILRSRNLWHPLSSSIPTNKRNVLFEIFKTSVCFLSMTVQLGVANNQLTHHQRIIQIVREESLHWTLKCLPALQH